MPKTTTKLNTPKTNPTPTDSLLQLLLDSGALKFKTRAEGDFGLKLKSRQSPFFYSLREIDDGVGLSALGAAYADGIIKAEGNGAKIDVLYGPPEAAISLVTAAAYALEVAGHPKPFYYTRKVPKDGAEKGKVDPQELAKLPAFTPDEVKALIVGRQPVAGAKVLLVDGSREVTEPPYEAISIVRRLGMEPAAIIMQNWDSGLTPQQVQEATGIKTVGSSKSAEGILQLGNNYQHALHDAGLITENGPSFEVVYGCSSEGISAAVATTMALKDLYEYNVPWFLSRNVLKTYGEATGTASGGTQAVIAAEEVKAFGYQPKGGEATGLLDDMITDGGTKDEAKEVVEVRFGGKVTHLFLTADRQEVNVRGKNAAEDWSARNSVPLSIMVGATDTHKFLTETNFENKEGLERMGRYMRVYGTKKARDYIGGAQAALTPLRRGIIPACDVENVDDFINVVAKTAPVDGVVAMKLGFSLSLGDELKPAMWVMKTANAMLDGKKVIAIYDHQKAGTDIPDTGNVFMKKLKAAGIDGVIIFPQAGPEVERAWIYRAFEAGLTVIVGGWMTHPGYAQSEGGFITDEGILEMYRIAVRAGVTHFVVPFTKPEAFAKIDAAIREEGLNDPFYMGPGIGAQGGSVADMKKAVGDGNEFYLHGIVGRAILQAEDKAAAAAKEVAELRR